MGRGKVFAPDEYAWLVKDYPAYEDSLPTRGGGPAFLVDCKKRFFDEFNTPKELREEKRGVSVPDFLELHLSNSPLSKSKISCATAGRK